MREAEFREGWERGRGKGKVSLRRAQFKLAETNASMAIFLGKLYLGQRNVTTGDLSRTNGGPIRMSEAKREFLRRIERIRAGEADRETE